MWNIKLKFENYLFLSKNKAKKVLYIYYRYVTVRQ